MLLLLLDSGKFGEVASCAAQSRRRPGFEFDAGNRVDLAKSPGYVDAGSAVQGFAYAHGLLRKTASPRPVSEWADRKILYPLWRLVDEEALERVARGLQLAKVLALAGGSPETSIVMYGVVAK